MPERHDDHAVFDVVAGAGKQRTRAGVREDLDARLTWSDDALVEPPFVLAHGPRPDPRGDTLAGHLHPVVRLGGRRGDRLRCSAFWFRADHAVLPAFGAFTGGYPIEASPGERVVVVGADDLVELPASPNAT